MNKKKKHIRILMALAALFIIVLVLPVSGQAPPPPAHSQNGNQVSPGGTGCPLDRTSGILLTLLFSLGYSGMVLYQRSKQKVAL